MDTDLVVVGHVVVVLSGIASVKLALIGHSQKPRLSLEWRRDSEI